MLIGLAVRAVLRQKALLLLLVIVFAVRLPFYVHPSGLISTSDNAVEALQSLQIMDTRQAPFFLQEALTHQGTVKYLWVSYLWEVFGPHYLLIVLLQTVLFALLLILLYEIIKPLIEKSALWLLLALNFAFIETVWDYSLYLRGAPYLEMLLFFWLGVYLFQAADGRSLRLFLGAFFIFFSIYIHPLAVFFALSFLAAMVWPALRAKALGKTLLWTVAGAAAGLWHWMYYLAFYPKPKVTGAWEEVGIMKHFPALGTWAAGLLKNIWQIFQNVFSFEFSYLVDFFGERNSRQVLIILNRTVIYLSAVVLVLGCGLALIRLARLVLKKESETGHSWVYLFTLFLLAGFLARTALLQTPRQEPRHNFDLIIALVLSYFFVFSALLRPRKYRLAKIIASAALLAALAVPHYHTFLRMAAAKQLSYEQLMTTLRLNRVKAVETDFILAYPIYYLSGRRIAVSDTIGPLSLHLFYRDMERRVDALPPQKKAYLFYSRNYPTRPWHKRATFGAEEIVRQTLLGRHIRFHVVRLPDYVLFIPRQGNS